jgi:protein-disulfide isomerase
MPVSRRILLTLVPTLALPAFARADEDMTRAERSIGKPDAKVTVNEYFSLTCTHCAAFAQGPFQQVKTQLIDPGTVRWVFHDYPLDQTALAAAMVARYLPVDRYEPFIEALFATQNRWAFNRGANPTDELWKTAALAGMGRSTFDKALADTGLRDWILAQQQADTKQWSIDSTPSFVIDNQKYAGEMSFEEFRKLIPS